nr:MAG TPA: hypothetical protein [Caudoviricetes sp.]
MNIFIYNRNIVFIAFCIIACTRSFGNLYYCIFFICFLFSCIYVFLFYIIYCIIL